MTSRSAGAAPLPPPRRVLLRLAALSLLAVLLLLLLGATASAPVTAAPILDQQYQPDPASTTFLIADVDPLSNSPVSAAQSFTAGRSGPLSQVDVLIRRNTALSLGPVVEISTASGGVPSGDVLASATIPPALLSTTYSWVTVSFSTPASVSAGQQYAIILRPPDGAQPPWNVRWQVDESGSYTGGGAARRLGTGPWRSDAGFAALDAGFRTYVAAAASPSVSINDVSVTEGDGGTTQATFTVSLSAAAANPVTVAFATADGTAQAGNDYVAQSGTLIFAPGDTRRSVSVAISGDTLDEPTETFTVALSNPIGATIADRTGFGAIIDDDDVPLPTLSISDATVTEGDSGTTPASFTVSLSGPSGTTIIVAFTTVNGTAQAGNDYIAENGTLTFSPGETSQSVAITINGDTHEEPTETFSVRLFSLTEATPVPDSGLGTILDDDAAPPPVAANDSATTPAGTPVTIHVLANDSGTDIRVTDVSNPPHGSVIVDPATRAIRYTPAAGFSGTDTFSYTITDIVGQMATATVAVTVTAAPTADLAITMTDSPDPVDAGTDLTYTLSVTNFGPDAAQLVTLTDPLPVGTTFVSLMAPGGWMCTTPAVGAGGTVTCARATLAVESQSFTLVVQVAASTPDPATLSNAATVAAATTDPNQANNTATVTTTVLAAPVGSFTVMPSVTTTPAGAPLQVTVTARNADGTVDTGYTGTVRFSSTDPAFVPPPDYTFTAADAGVHVFPVTFQTAGSQAVTVTDVMTSARTGTSPPVTVTAAPVAALTLGEPTVNGALAGSLPGPTIPAGTMITIAVPVTNSGTVPLFGLAGTSAAGLVSCPRLILAPNDTTACSVTVPAAAGAQQVAITISAQAQNGQLVSAATTAYYMGTSGPAAPTITAITPAEGSTEGGTRVTLTGSGFQPGASVTFDSLPATGVAVVSATEIRATTPAHPAGAVTVSVHNPGGQRASLPQGFTYLPPAPPPPPPAPPQPMTLTGQVWRQVPPIVSEGQFEWTVVPVVGGVVEAFVGSTVCGQAVADSQGRFQLTVAADPPVGGCGRPGRALSFRVNGAMAASDPLAFQSDGQAAVTLILPGPQPPQRR